MTLLNSLNSFLSFLFDERLVSRDQVFNNPQRSNITQSASSSSSSSSNSPQLRTPSSRPLIVPLEDDIWHAAHLFWLPALVSAAPPHTAPSAEGCSAADGAHLLSTRMPRMIGDAHATYPDSLLRLHLHRLLHGHCYWSR